MFYKMWTTKVRQFLNPARAFGKTVGLKKALIKLHYSASLSSGYPLQPLSGHGKQGLGES
jgi:hypothetical protein